MLLFSNKLMSRLLFFCPSVPGIGHPHGLLHDAQTPVEGLLQRRVSHEIEQVVAEVAVVVGAVEAGGVQHLTHGQRAAQAVAEGGSLLEKKLISPKSRYKIREAHLISVVTVDHGIS